MKNIVWWLSDNPGKAYTISLLVTFGLGIFVGRYLL